MMHPLLLPPELFPLELQPIIYFILLPLAVVVFAFILPSIFWFIFMTPNARTETLDRLKKRDLIEVQVETGVSFIETVKVRPEGFMVGDKTKNIYVIPRPTQKEVILDEMQTKGATDEDIKKVQDQLKNLEKQTLNASIVKGLGVRKFYAYQSFGIATTLAQLVGLDLEGIENKEVYMAVPVVAKTNKRSGPIKPVDLVLNKNERLKEWLVKVVLPVTPSLVQKHFNKNYTQNQLIAIYKAGIEEGKESVSNPLGKWLMPILIIVIIGAVILLGATFLLSGGGTPTA